MGYLYKHIRLDKNEVFYIGIGGFSKYEKEGSYQRAYSKNRNNMWKTIVSKTDYIVEIILDNLSKEEAIEKEKEYIKLYGRKDLNEGSLTNMTDGGDGQINMSEATKKKISIASKKRIGDKNPFFGKKHTEESLKKIGKYKRTEINSFAIKKAFAEGKLNTKGDKNGQAKKIYQIQEDGSIVREYNYITEVENYGFTRRNVHYCLSGKKYRYKGFYWVYDLSDFIQKPYLESKSNGSKLKGYWTKEKCFEESKKYNSQKDFRKGSGGAYDRARKEGWMEEIKKHYLQK